MCFVRCFEVCVSVLISDVLRDVLPLRDAIVKYTFSDDLFVGGRGPVSWGISEKSLVRMFVLMEDALGD